MSRLHRFIKNNRHTIYLVIIVLAVGGSMLMMAIQGSRVSEQATQLRNQNETLKAQVEAIKEFNERRDEAVADLIADNARQTSYLECLLSLQGVPVTDQIKEECRIAADQRRDEVRQEQDLQREQNKQQNTPDQPPAGSNGNGNENPQPEQTYTQCVTSGDGVLRKLGRVISCL